MLEFYEKLLFFLIFDKGEKVKVENVIVVKLE